MNHHSLFPYSLENHGNDADKQQIREESVPAEGAGKKRENKEQVRKCDRHNVERGEEGKGILENDKDGKNQAEGGGNEGGVHGDGGDDVEEEDGGEGEKGKAGLGMQNEVEDDVEDGGRHADENGVQSEPDVESEDQKQRLEKKQGLDEEDENGEGLRHAAEEYSQSVRDADNHEVDENEGSHQVHKHDCADESDIAVHVHVRSDLRGEEHQNENQECNEEEHEVVEVDKYGEDLRGGVILEVLVGAGAEHVVHKLALLVGQYAVGIEHLEVAGRRA